MVMFRKIDTNIDTILQYMIREYFDDEMFFVLLLKMGSCPPSARGLEHARVFSLSPALQRPARNHTHFSVFSVVTV
jgi:hypothetical protein